MTKVKKTKIHWRMSSLALCALVAPLLHLAVPIVSALPEASQEEPIADLLMAPPLPGSAALTTVFSSDSCLKADTTNDSAAGILFITDQRCRTTPGPGCLAGTPCRQCRTAASNAKPASYLPCTDLLTQINNMPMPTGVCAGAVAVKFGSVGISATSDPTCGTRDSSCVTSSCRACWIQSTDMSSKYAKCPGVAPVTTPSPVPQVIKPLNGDSATCAPQTIYGKAVRIKRVYDSTCTRGEKNCDNNSCRFCKTGPVDPSDTTYTFCIAIGNDPSDIRPTNGNESTCKALSMYSNSADVKHVYDDTCYGLDKDCSIDSCRACRIGSTNSFNKELRLCSTIVQRGKPASCASQARALFKSGVKTFYDLSCTRNMADCDQDLCRSCKFGSNVPVAYQKSKDCNYFGLAAPVKGNPSWCDAQAKTNFGQGVKVFYDMSCTRADSDCDVDLCRKCKFGDNVSSGYRDCSYFGIDAPTKGKASNCASNAKPLYKLGVKMFYDMSCTSIDSDCNADLCRICKLRIDVPTEYQDNQFCDYYAFATPVMGNPSSCAARAKELFDQGVKIFYDMSCTTDDLDCDKDNCHVCKFGDNVLPQYERATYCSDFGIDAPSRGNPFSCASQAKNLYKSGVKIFYDLSCTSTNLDCDADLCRTCQFGNSVPSMYQDREDCSYFGIDASLTGNPVECAKATDNWSGVKVFYDLSCTSNDPGCNTQLCRSCKFGDNVNYAFVNGEECSSLGIDGSAKGKPFSCISQANALYKSGVKIFYDQSCTSFDSDCDADLCRTCQFGDNMPSKYQTYEDCSYFGIDATTRGNPLSCSSQARNLYKSGVKIFYDLSCTSANSDCDQDLCRTCQFGSNVPSEYQATKDCSYFDIDAEEQGNPIQCGASFAEVMYPLGVKYFYDKSCTKFDSTCDPYLCRTCRFGTLVTRSNNGRQECSDLGIDALTRGKPASCASQAKALYKSGVYTFYDYSCTNFDLDCDLDLCRTCKFGNNVPSMYRANEDCSYFGITPQTPVPTPSPRLPPLPQPKPTRCSTLDSATALGLKIVFDKGCVRGNELNCDSPNCRVCKFRRDVESNVQSYPDCSSISSIGDPFRCPDPSEYMAASGLNIVYYKGCVSGNEKDCYSPSCHMCKFRPDVATIFRKYADCSYLVGVAMPPPIQGSIKMAASDESSEAALSPLSATQSGVLPPSA